MMFGLRACWKAKSIRLVTGAVEDLLLDEMKNGCEPKETEIS